MRDRLVVNGKDLADFGVYLTNAGVYTTPEKDVEEIEIPGKSGTVQFSKNRYKNVRVSYPCGIPFVFKENFGNLISFLCSQQGYCRLEDTFFPDFYRNGIFTASVSPHVSWDGEIGTFELEFNCKPQRWLKEGEEPIAISSTGAILSPCYEDCKPLIKIEAAGSVTINGITISVSSMNSGNYALIDCETKNVYGNLGSLNLYSMGAFPVLSSGENEITTTTPCEITPRWWFL